MFFSAIRAHKLVHLRADRGSGLELRVYLAEIFVALLFLLFFAVSAHSQDRGSLEAESFGKGAEITVTVHDASGEPISSVAMVKIFRSGGLLSAQGETSDGRSTLVVNNIGDFSVLVQAPGYGDAQKDISIYSGGSAQVDIYLHASSNSGSAGSVPGRALLAPKAQKAVEKTLEAINAGKNSDAERFIGEALRLAPGNPDVLYVQGVLKLKQGNWAEAQSSLEQAIQIDPNNARAFSALGMAYCDEGKYREAIEALEKALQLEPAGSWETRWTLAKAYYQGQKYRDALEMAQTALTKSDGKAPEIALLVAQSLTAVGRYDDAALALRSFVRDHGELREAATAKKWLTRLNSSGKLTAQNH
jgi:Flp pilus assembly protein TadD